MRLLLLDIFVFAIRLDVPTAAHAATSRSELAIVVVVERQIRYARLGQVVLHQIGFLLFQHELLPLRNHQLAQYAPLVRIALLQIGHLRAHYVLAFLAAAFQVIVMRDDVMVLLFH